MTTFHHTQILVRLIPTLSLGALAGVAGCYGHHTADEALVESDSTRVEDGGVAHDAKVGDGSVDAATDPCAAIADTDIIGQITCDLANNSAGGALGTPSNSQCKNVDPTDIVTQGLCLLGSAGGTQTGGANTNANNLGNIVDLLTLLGGLNGSGGTGTQTGGLAGLLGGAGTGTGANNANGLGNILGLLGGLQGGTGAGANNANGLADILGLLGGLQGGAGTTPRPGTTTTGTAGNANNAGLAGLIQLLGGAQTRAAIAPDSVAADVASPVP